MDWRIRIKLELFNSLQLSIMLLNEEVSWFLESFMPTEIFVLHRLLSILCYEVRKLPPLENVKTKFEIQYSDELQIYVILKLMSNLQC